MTSSPQVTPELLAEWRVRLGKSSLCGLNQGEALSLIDHVEALQEENRLLRGSPVKQLTLAEMEAIHDDRESLRARVSQLEGERDALNAELSTRCAAVRWTLAEHGHPTWHAIRDDDKALCGAKVVDQVTEAEAQTHPKTYCKFCEVVANVQGEVAALTEERDALKARDIQWQDRALRDNVTLQETYDSLRAKLSAAEGRERTFHDNWMQAISEHTDRNAKLKAAEEERDDFRDAHERIVNELVTVGVERDERAAKLKQSEERVRELEERLEDRASATVRDSSQREGGE